MLPLVTNGPPTVPDRPHVVLLFDGACHLCDAAVQWVIARDASGQFHFAALQSAAARTLLVERGVGRLPDSLVLVDETGVHVQSEAALRVAARLGRPWSWLALARLVPRSLRDAVYAWVATNRYRWFGRRDVCVRPTPELRARFLDRDEPVAMVDDAVAGSPDMSGPPLSPQAAPRAMGLSWVRAFVQRVIPAYLAVYVFPFPAGAVAGTEWLAMGYLRVTEWLTQPVGWWLFGRALPAPMNGSGDTSFSYAFHVVAAIAGLLVAAVWTLVSSGAPVRARTTDRVRMYVRYSLASTMFTYGWIKVFGMQMPAPGPDRLVGTIGDMSPMGLLWTFMGASTAYQAFAGASEVLGGTLLLWRRTTLLGALVSAAVMTHVVVLNFSYDVPVKLFSTHLLLMALWLAVPHAPRLAALFLLGLPTAPTSTAAPAARRLPRWLTAVFVFLIAVVPAVTAAQRAAMVQRQTARSSLHGIYRVASASGQSALGVDGDDTTPWTRLGINVMGLGAVQRASGRSSRIGVTIDEKAGTIGLRPAGTPPSAAVVVPYALDAAGALRLEGDVGGRRIAIVLQKEASSTSLLMDRRFHWINEFPLNR
jgi:predicted DCC family thiol-disulfide oxidoreductase YuxK